MKIMIMQCSDDSCWYKGCIGKTFPVVKEDSKDYYIKTKKEPAAVLKTDAAVI